MPKKVKMLIAGLVLSGIYLSGSSGCSKSSEGPPPPAKVDPVKEAKKAKKE
jgi:hypothetical protein